VTNHSAEIRFRLGGGASIQKEALPHPKARRRERGEQFEREMFERVPESRGRGSSKTTKRTNLQSDP